MSVVIETLIFCDGDHAGYICPQDGPYGDGDSRSLSAAEQRKTYRKDGWRHVGGRDYCPSCATKIRPSSTRSEKHG